MKDFIPIIIEMVSSSIEGVKLIGDEGRRSINQKRGKDTCLVERLICDTVKEVADKYFESYLLRVEGFPIISRGINPTLRIVVDPIDGTCYYVRQRSKTPFPISTVVSIIDGNKYNDVKAAAIGDITTEEIWYATNETSTFSSKIGEVHVGGNEQHDPLWLTDFHFPENALVRSILRNPKNNREKRFECLNIGSVAEQGAKVACGEADLFYNVIGPKAFELSAMYLIVKQAGGYGIHLITGKEIGEIKFQFNERIPVVLAKDEESAENFYNFYMNQLRLSKT